MTRTRIQPKPAVDPVPQGWRTLAPQERWFRLIGRVNAVQWHRGFMASSRGE
jgi:hypothetical protein